MTINNLLKKIDETATAFEQQMPLNTLPEWDRWKSFNMFYRDNREMDERQFSRETALAWIIRHAITLLSNVDPGSIEQCSPFYPSMQRVGAARVISHVVSAAESIVRGPSEFVPDFFSELLARILPSKYRKPLGQFYTRTWLVEEIHKLVTPYLPVPADRISYLDPSCGTGAFLAPLWQKGYEKVYGFELDPLVALTAQFSYLSQRVAQKTNSSPIFQLDAFSLASAERQLFMAETLITFEEAGKSAESILSVDCLIGNPPWVTWADLSKPYREFLKPLWFENGLVQKKGYRLLLGNSRADIAHLFTFHCMETFLKDNGIIAFLLPLSAIKGSEASSHFRSFRLASGKEIEVLEIHDLSAIRPFDDAVGDTCILIARKCGITKYPIPYVEWRQSPGGIEKLRRCAFIPTPAGPFLLLHNEKSEHVIPKMLGASDYQARQGINTCGANAIFFFEPENIPNIEEAYLYPLLRYNDVQRWHAVPTLRVLFPYDRENPKTPIALSEIRRDSPKSYRYFTKHRTTLKNRTSAVIQNNIKNNLYHTLFGVGSYTFARWKVVWQSFGAKKMSAAVVSKEKCKPIIPNQALHCYIATDERDEAYFLAGVLNSFLFEYAVGSINKPGSKSYAQPSILNKIRIPRYENSLSLHRQITELSKQLHIEWKNPSRVKEYEHDLDDLVGRIWGITTEETEQLRHQ
jgi:SAM-dependent methyltransferase